MKRSKQQRPEILPGQELGRIRTDGEWLSVHYHCDRAMWLCRDADFRSTVGIIRWDIGKSPQLILDPNDRRFDHPHGEEVVGMVDLAMAVWWCVVNTRPLDPLLPVAIHPGFKSAVVYWSRNSRPDLAFPRHGAARPAQSGTGPADAHHEPGGTRDQH